MNNLNTLKKTLEVVMHADREASIDSPLHQVKALFDGLQLDDAIDFDSQYGQLIRVVLDAKRKDVAMKNLIFARGVLQTMIKELELENIEQEKTQKAQDALAIDSTCIIVTGNDKIVTVTDNIKSNFNELQLQLDNMPKKIGRPKSENALTGAERAKRARDKKKNNDLVTINSTLSKHESELYNIMISKGYDLNHIIMMAYGASPTPD